MKVPIIKLKDIPKESPIQLPIKLKVTDESV